MTPAPNFDSAQLKIDRALLHLRQFQSEADHLLAAYRSSVVCEREIEGTHVYRLRGAPDIPAHWSALVGDVLHNLRSALDHLAWQLVVASDGTPRRKPQRGSRATQFPILLAPPDDADGPTISGGLRDDLRARVIAEQPYVRWPDNPRMSPLALLNELNNIDKHVGVVPVAVAIRGVAWNTPAGIDVEFYGDPSSSVRNGDVVVRRMTQPPYDSPMNVDIEFWLLASDLWPESRRGSLHGWLLGSIGSYVEAVVHRFRQLVERP